jgi:hypothetical protein
MTCSTTEPSVEQEVRKLDFNASRLARGPMPVTVAVSDEPATHRFNSVFRMDGRVFLIF